jgi:hypothetical protein
VVDVVASVSPVTFQLDGTTTVSVPLITIARSEFTQGGAIFEAPKLPCLVPSDAKKTGMVMCARNNSTGAT